MLFPWVAVTFWPFFLPGEGKKNYKKTTRPATVIGPEKKKNKKTPQTDGFPLVEWRGIK